MPWNRLELKSACDARGIIVSIDLLAAITDRFWRVNYFLSNAQTIFERIFHDSETGDIDQSRIDEYGFRIEAEVEAVFYSLDSMPDQMAQLINVVLLSSVIQEKRVNIYLIRNELARTARFSDLVQRINTFIGSTAYRYVRAFTNITKHRRLLDFEFCFESGEGTRDEMGFRVLDFTYDGNHYDPFWHSDLEHEIIDRYKTSIEDIGNGINMLLV